MFLYYALFFSHLTYGCLTWQFANSSLINKLRVLQRKAVRVISFSLPRDSTTPLSYLLELLKVDDIFDSCVLQFIYNLVIRVVPESLFCLFHFSSRIVNNNNVFLRIIMPPINSSKYSNLSLRCAGAKIWNNFLKQNRNSLSAIKSLFSLKSFYKKKCLTSYQSSSQN